MNFESPEEAMRAKLLHGRVCCLGCKNFYPDSNQVWCKRRKYAVDNTPLGRHVCDKFQFRPKEYENPNDWIPTDNWHRT